MAEQKIENDLVPGPWSDRVALFLIWLAEMLGEKQPSLRLGLRSSCGRSRHKNEVKYRPDSSDAFLPFFSLLSFI